MEKYFENIFDKLYSRDESALWYKARYYVMDILPPIDGEYGIGISDNKYVHVVLENTNIEMLAVARQIALVAHYPNYNDKTEENTTLITFCNSNINEIQTIKKTFGNLLDYCNIKGLQDKSKNAQRNDYLPLDIEFEFVNKSIDNINTKNNDHLTLIKYSDVKKAFDSYQIPEEGIDVTKGMLVNMVYLTGAEIDNLPPNDNDNVSRYSMALNVFCYKLKEQEIRSKWENVERVEDKLSSIICGDCFESRLKSILDTKKKSLLEYLLYDFEFVMQKLKDSKTINALAKCEHSRWNVEKLILGFSPLKKDDWYKVENSFGKERNEIIRNLKKKEKKHIDLCSNQNLQRVHPGNLKYDYFLMLAIPQILLSKTKYF